MVGTKEKVEDTVGKMTGAMIVGNGKAINMAMHLHGNRNGQRIVPTDDRMPENGEKFSMAATITAALALGRALGTRGMDQEGTHGPTANRVHEERDRVREEEEKETRDIMNLLLRHTRERPGAGARTRTGLTTGSPPKVGGPTDPTMMTRTGVIHGRPTGLPRSIYHK